MENPQTPEGPQKQDKGFHLFAAKRIVMATVGVLALIWLASYALSLVDTHDAPSAPHAPKIVADHGRQAEGESHTKAATEGHGPPAAAAEHASTAPHAAATPDPESHGQAADHTAETSHAAEAQSGDAHRKAADDHAPAAGDHGTAKKDTHAAEEGGHGATSEETHAPADHAAAEDKAHAPKAGDHSAASEETHTPADHGAAEDLAHAPEAHALDEHGAGDHGGIPVSDVKGVTFVMAAIAPLQYELEEHFYGWRPNDIIRLTDDVNNFQLGVLEVSRRTVEVLTDSISRTGEVQAFDKDLEKARNNLMINADDYILPSAESSYEDALAALARYKAKLEKGTAAFYSRTDNLIPLLVEFKNLLGSCDDNLAKYHEDDGSEVSWFQADDYFFYAQGVANAMQTILQAVAVDFSTVVETRRSADVLHHALNALHHATAIKPWFILDGDPDGFTANHRANLAAPISHARFYIALLIQTLST